MAENEVSRGMQSWMVAALTTSLLFSACSDSSTGSAPDASDAGDGQAPADDGGEVPADDGGEDVTDDGGQVTADDGDDVSAEDQDPPQDDDLPDAADQPGCTSPRPIVFVHGMNGSDADFATMIQRLQDDGWPADYLVPFNAEDPAWGCNVDNAAAIAELVQETLAAAGHPRVDMVAHSMGTLSSRYYVKSLGGTGLVNTYISMGGMNHGLASPCWAPDFLNVCVWQELCETGDFIQELNADPATPEPVMWVTIYGTGDSQVPNESTILPGAENIEIQGAEHIGDNGLLEREDAYQEVLRVLQYPCLQD